MQYTLEPDLWMAKADWYNPKRHRANFVIMDSQPGNFSHWEPYLLVKRYFGPPARTYRLGWYTIMVWNRNLLKALPTDDPFGLPPRSVRQQPVMPGPLGPVHPSLQDVTEHR
jgi:hypothetical protein